MKRYFNLMPKIATFKNLLVAFQKASVGKKNKRYVKEFYFNLEANLLEIQTDLLTNKYNWGTYTVFEITDNKKRFIHAPQFRDRVTQHAIVAIIEPLIDKKFIDHSYACRKGKGTLKGVQYFMKMNSNQNNYVLKCDIKQYFKTVDRLILYNLLQKNIKDKLVLKVFYDLLFYNQDETGIPICNLCSQLFANLYLNQLDYFIKQELKVKKYVRYMDDFLITHNSKEQLKIWRNSIREFLDTQLKLELHPHKQHIVAARGGINWLGYKVVLTKIQVMNKNVKAFTKRWKTILSKKQPIIQDLYIQLNSFYALSKHATARHYIYTTYRSRFLEIGWVSNLIQLKLKHAYPNNI